MNRRRLLSAALGAAAAGAFVRFVGAPVPSQAAPPGQFPGKPPMQPPGLDPDQVMAQADGSYMTHLLPFAAPFPSEAAARSAVARARALGLFR